MRSLDILKTNCLKTNGGERIRLKSALRSLDKVRGYRDCPGNEITLATGEFAIVWMYKRLNYLPMSYVDLSYKLILRYWLCSRPVIIEVSTSAIVLFDGLTLVRNHSIAAAESLLEYAANMLKPRP